MSSRGSATMTLKSSASLISCLTSRMGCQSGVRRRTLIVSLCCTSVTQRTWLSPSSPLRSASTSATRTLPTLHRLQRHYLSRQHRAQGPRIYGHAHQSHRKCLGLCSMSWKDARCCLRFPTVCSVCCDCCDIALQTCAFQSPLRVARLSRNPQKLWQAYMARKLCVTILSTKCSPHLAPCSNLPHAARQFQQPSRYRMLHRLFT